MCDCCTNLFQLKCCGNFDDPCESCKTCYDALEDLVNHLLKVAGGVGLFFSFTLVSFLSTNVHSLRFWATGRYSRFQMTGMVIGGQKTKPKKIPGPNINPQKIPNRTYEATRTGTTMNLQIVLNTPYLNQVTQENTCHWIFRPPPPPAKKKKKNPGIKNFKPKKSFNHPCHLKPRAPSLGFGEPAHRLECTPTVIMVHKT